MKTNILKSHLFVIGCILVGLCLPAWAANLPFGQTETGTISSPAQSNSYTFSANANDVVDFTMVTTSGTLIPEISLYNSAGKLIASNYSGSPYGCGGSGVELNAVTLPASDTYTVLVGDCAHTNTGNYDLYAQRTNNPSGAASLPFGGTETGTIGSAAQSNTYTFSANANDVVDFTMTTTSGSLVPKIRLYNPSGTLLTSNYSGNPYGCGGSVVELNAVTLPVSGTYTVLVGDCSDTSTGNYDLYAQRTNNPSGAANLPFGGTETGTIGSAAQSNTYTFSANASDVVDFTMTTTSGSLVPKIRLYNPTGTLLASNYSGNPYGCGGSVVELNAVTLPVSGTYTVLVGDCSDTNTGNYDIYAQRTDDSSGPKLAFGKVKTGKIGSAAQSNSYTFSANASDVVDFTMTTTSGSLVPKIRLYNPTGTLLASNYSGNPYGCGGSVVELNTVTLPASGIYTVLVGDCSDTNTGDYNLYTQRTNKPSGAKKLILGQTETGKIISAAQSGSYTFSANANDVVDFTMTTTSGSLVPKIRLYNPTGTLLASNYSGNPYGCGGSVVELNAVTLPVSGTYTVLVGDCSDRSAGDYAIYAQRTNNPSGATGVLWGQVQPGTIGSAAQSNSYTFSGITNNVVDFTMTTTSGSLVPKIRLYNPSGTLLASNYSGNPYGCGGTTVQLNSVTLPAGGTYTVLVGDCSDTNTGNYNLSSECFGTCPMSTTTTLSSSPNPSVHGQAVTFTAVVSSGAGTPPNGETVSFMKGKVVLGTGTLSDGSATFMTSTLPVGTNSITAVYGGDANFGGSTSNVVKQVVEKTAE